MKPPPGLSVTPSEWEVVRAILLRHVREREIWAFGSRVRGTAKPFSDLDLAILGNQALPPGIRTDLADDFAESDLPYKVDLIEWATTSDRFRAIIDAAPHIILLQDPPRISGIVGRR